MSSSDDTSTLIEAKLRVEEQFPEFPLIDINAPDFSTHQYARSIRELFLALGAPYEDISITWSDLTCTVPVEKPSESIATVVSAFSAIGSAIKHGGAKLRHNKSESKAAAAKNLVPKKANVLNAASGAVEPGEMCLVLGPSGSGASLLLSRIAGRPLGKAVQNKGKVLYNSREKLGNIVDPAHYIQFVGQQDEHLAPLTVRDTLRFAADCKWPEWMPHVETIRSNDVLLTARMLGIERTLDTVVGDDTLRGVSGGEKKRVTIAEMLIGLNSGAIVMDNWSKGLDANTTLSITRSMREFSTYQQTPVIASMQAPGTDAFNEFDTVCVLDKGYMLYFGPRDQVEDWFKGLGFSRPPQRSIPDFVATISNPDLRGEYLMPHADLSGLDLAPPVTPEEFAQRFAASHLAAQNQERIERILREHADDQFDVPVELQKTAQKRTLQKSRYQIRAIGKRQWRYLGATRNAVFADILQNLILGSVLGSIFWQLPDTSGGASTRGGIIFLAFLFIGLSSLSKIGERHEQKNVYAKQTHSSFYNAFPFIFTMLLFDIVLELVRTASFVVPLYLMSGLNLGSSAQRLLYAVLIITMLSLVMTSMTRFLVAAFDDPNAAEGLGGILTILMVLFAGFMKRPDEIDGWLVWIYWADPLHYVYEALIVNEFDGLVFQCEPEELLPPVPDSIIPREFRICPVSTGEAFLENNLGVTVDPIFRLYYFIVIVGYLVLFVSVSAIATALAKPHGHALKLSQNGDESNLDTELTSTVIDMSTTTKRAEDASFTFSNVKYAVDNGKKALLAGVSGYSKSGTVVSLMGSSGAGKSTLLDVCAKRKTMGKGTSSDGDIRIHNVPLSKDLVAYFTGYCEQTDLHVKEATVEEAVKFSAKLRLPASMPVREKNVRAMETIDMLGLTPYADLLVKALGSGELKLLTMALEVVADPVVLFLDEPTSGISASSALVVANAIRKIADSGSCVICTIHQPSKEVFSMFDKLLLLKRGGKQVYFGDIGENGKAIRDYFESRGAPAMSEIANPADWMLSVVSDESHDWAEEWNASSEKEKMEREVDELQYATPEAAKAIQEPYKRPGFMGQLREVLQRLFLRYWRLPEYNFTRVVLMTVIAIMVGLLFLRDINDTQAGALLSFSALFLTVIPSSLSAQNVILPTVEGRTVFYREIASGTYKPFVFHVALGIVEIPFTIVATTFFTVIFYFLVGLTPSRFGFFFLACQVLYYFSVMLGVMLASITPGAPLAAMIASSLTSVFNVLSGFFIRKDQMPVWWRWSTWINPFFYFLAGLVRNEMTDRVFVCEPSEFVFFDLPTDLYTSCAEIPGGFGDGGIVDGSQMCTFCPIPNGESLIQNFGADAVNKWVGLVAVLVSIAICRVIAGIGFSRLRFITR
eukprot:GFKZ01004018.1.p1 GENE.GFKZ01004018.1~~GFKZ01004018.1.p1  ORF type:complete len:1383 (+),score=196.71 GFKZ01004018.1:418-4566(+)